MQSNRKYTPSNFQACLLLILLALFLQACSGFKPRSEASLISTPLKGVSVHIDNTDLEQDFMRLLQRGLRESGATLVSETLPQAISLKIIDLEEDKTVSAYSSVRQVREFNHYIELDFSATRTRKNQGQPIISKVRAERAQIYDSRYVLGVSAEERSIRDELRAEVVRLMALRLSALR